MAFENFSLSKFAKHKVPHNYIDPQKVSDPKAVQDVQRKMIVRQLENFPETDSRNVGVTLTFPALKLAEIKESLPGVGEHGGEVKTDDVLDYLRGRMNGTTFYSRGAPALQRLSAAMQMRAQARAIIERVKNGSRENRRMGPQNAAARNRGSKRRVARRA